jgi:hypothetical protein
MALVVEDGTGIANADAYVAVDFVNEYASKFGKSGWNELELDTQEVHIRRATQFADNVYLNDYPPLKTDQRLAIPSSSLYVRGTKISNVPIQVKEAVAELAIISVTNDLIAIQTDRQPTQRTVKVGDVSKSETFSNEFYKKIFHSVEMMLRPLDQGISNFNSGFSQSRVLRA